MGTARRPPARVERSVGEAVPGAPEASLLDLAAIATARRRAGRRPDRATADQEAPAGPDHMPEVPAEPVATLSVLLAGHAKVPGGPGGLMKEWFERCAAARRRLPHRHLLAVLGLAESRPELRPAVAAIVDERGRWLARRLGTWPWVERLHSDLFDPAAHDSDAVTVTGIGTWRTGTAAERTEVLRALRRRRPDRARALVEETWATDGAAERVTHAEALAVNLTMADEPFLETALDDRSKLVRAVAVRLLERLPGSRRAARMAARALPLVRSSDRVPHRVEMDFPAEPDAGSRRDGITDTRDEPMGLAAWWAVQMVAGTSLPTWEAHLGAAPGVLLQRASGCDHLLVGWRRAASAQRHPGWCTALFRSQPRPELLALLDADDAAGLLTEVMDRVADRQLQPLLSATAGPWSPALSRRVVSRLLAIAPDTFTFRPDLYVVLADRLDPAVGPAVDALATHLAERDHQRSQVRSVRLALSLRETIRTQFDQLDLQPPSPEPTRP
jgi:hypothetical protein